ncbi:hypothetical protein BB561_005541 [Smittium simulii]|uniref:Myosin motor domain-containing protein n=1 Tax=Smittium simulii TaxID=133385 RepID=A0A2T9Y9T7_9FUNG|nr:hypothetical protein BB561_005541 [Smittium simulii]
MDQDSRSPTVSALTRAMQNSLHIKGSLSKNQYVLSDSNVSIASTPISFMPYTSQSFFEQAGLNFADKKWVWVPDEKEGFVAGYVSDEKPNEFISVHLITGKDIEISADSIEKVNPPKFDRIEDMAELGYLNEASIVYNIKQRYSQSLIYTYSGPFLVAVNPYYNLNLYTNELVQLYKNKRREENPPHIFAIADTAYQALLRSRKNQSILITGESGAGKTENTKRVIQYLTSIAYTSQNVKSASRDLESQIISTNPILESFGNAQTIRNNNSSRFGKFIRIEFNSAGSISGANIEWYLLEKLRITNQSSHERNFHVFYQLLKGASDELKEKLLFENDTSKYAYTKNCVQTIHGVDDKANFEILKKSLKLSCFSDTEIIDLFRVLSAILNIGNIEFQADRSDRISIKNEISAEKTCHLLGISLAEFKQALLKPIAKAGKETFTQSRTVRQVVYSIEALSRRIYEKMFGCIVNKINFAMHKFSGSTCFIGVLDIAGFEILENNSFEQLCINYTNERLQQFFNHNMFILEQQEYNQEGIKWEFIDFGLDLQPTIDLIDKSNPVGILPCLDEHCLIQNSSDKSFTDNLNKTWAGKSQKYDKPRFNMGFIIHHYASQVEYDTTGWIEKNKDPLNENLAQVLSKSSEKFIAQLFSEYNPEASSSSTNSIFSSSIQSINTKSNTKTVSQRHKVQLNSLMNNLKQTEPHFVRCIVPNKEKQAGKIDTPLVIEQLRCNGVLEGIRITRQGFPNRELFTEFRQRYEILAPEVVPKDRFIDNKQAVQLILESIQINSSDFRLGNTKVFFRTGVLAEIEERRDTKLSKIIIIFQAIARGYTCRNKFQRRINQAKSIRLIQRNIKVYNQLCDWPWWKLYMKIKPLLHVTRVDEELKKKDIIIADLSGKAEIEKNEKDSKNDIERKLNDTIEKFETEISSRENLDNINSFNKVQLDTLDKLVEEYKAKVDTATVLHEESELLVKELDNQIQEMKNNEINLQDTIEKLSSDNEELNKDTLLYKQNLEELKKKVNLQQTEINTYLDQIKKLEELQNEVEQSREINRNIQEQSQQKIQGLKNHLFEINKKYESQEKINLDLAKEKDELEITLGDKLSEINKIELDKEKMSNLENQINQLTLEKQNFKESLEDLNEQLDDMAQRELIMEDERSGLREQLVKSIENFEQVSHELEEKNNEIQNLSTDILTLEKKLEDQCGISANLKEELSKLQSDNSDRSINSDKFKKAVDSSNQKITELTAQLEEQENMRDKFQNQLTEQSYEIEGLRDQLEHTLELQSNNLDIVRNEARAELEDLLSAYNEMEQKLKESNELKFKLEEELEQLKHNILEEKSLVIQINEEKEKLESRSIELDKDSQTIQSNLKTLEAKIQEISEKNQSLEKELKDNQDDFSKEIDALKSQITVKSDSIAETEEIKKKLESKINELQAQLEIEKNSKSSIEDIKKKLEDQQIEFRKILEEEVGAKIKSVEESSKILLEETNELRTSLNGAIKDKEVSQEQVNNIKEELAEQKKISESNLLQIITEKDKIIQQLENELNAEKDLNRQHESLLDNNRTLISEYEKKINTLNSSIKDLNNHADFYSKPIEELERTIEKVSAEAAVHLESRNQLESKNNIFQKEITSLKEQLEKVNDSHSNIDKSCRSLNDELNSVKTDLEKEQNEKKALQSSIEQSEANSISLSQALDQANKEIEEKQRELNELDISFGDLQRGLFEAQQKNENIIKEHDSALRSIEDLKQELDGKNKSSRKIIAHESILLQSLTDLQSELSQSKSIADGIESKYIKSEKQLKEAESKLSEYINAANIATELRDSAESNLKIASSKLIELENLLDNKIIENEELIKVQARLIDEIDELSKNHQLRADNNDSSIEELVAKYQTELKKISAELDSTKHDYLNLRQAYITLDKSVVNKTQELEKTKIQNEEISKELSHAINKVAEISPAYEKSRDIAKVFETQLSSVKLEMDSLHLKYTALESVNKEISAAKEKLELRIDEIQSKFVETNSSRQIAEKAALQLEDEIKSLNNKLEELNEMVAGYEKRNISLEDIVKDTHLALEKEREANTILTKKNNELEKVIKDLRIKLIHLDSKLIQSNNRESCNSRDIPSIISEKFVAEAKQNTANQSLVKNLENQIRSLNLQINDHAKNKQRSASELKKVYELCNSLEKKIESLELVNEQLNIEKKKNERAIEDSSNLTYRLMRELELLRPSATAQ